MNAKLSSLKSHFANWREWEFNPIVIKELRQGVRSWTVSGMLLLFLMILFIVSLAFLITQSFDVTTDMGLGGTMFSWFVAILAGASFFFIPLYTGVRVAAERQENNIDLLYVTTLSPARIIFGKFLCSAYIVVLFFSACMPFMAFTNLLRGVDLPTVFFILAFLFLFVCAANMVAIFFACLPLSRPFKFLFVIYGIFQSFGAIASLVALSFEFMRSGVGAMMTESNFWIGTLTVTAIVLTVIGLFFVLSTSLISPLSANRALPVRAYITVAWCVGGLLNLWWVWQTKEVRLIAVWQIITIVLMLLSLVNVISNVDQLSQRVRRTIPRSAWWRPVAFFFYNGAAGGVAWAAMICVLTFLTGLGVVTAGKPWITASAISDDSSGVEFFTISRIIVLYAFAYALTALFIHRKFLPNRPPKLAGLLAILLAGGWAIAPSIFLFFVNQLTWKSVEGLQLGNVFNVVVTRDTAQLVYHLYFAVGWLLLTVLLNAKWFWIQIKAFRPYEKAEPPVIGA